MAASEVLIAFLLVSIAGLSTGIESLIAYFIKKPKLGFLSFALGLSGGVMTYVSFVELLPLAIDAVGDIWGVIVFFIGVGFMFLLDQVIPEVDHNPHHIVVVMDEERSQNEANNEDKEEIKENISEKSKKV